MIKQYQLCRCPDCQYEEAELYLDDHGLHEIYCPMCCEEEDIEDNKKRDENLNVSYPFDVGWLN